MTHTMTASDLKVGSTLEVEVFTTDENAKMVRTMELVTIERCSDVFVWFKHMGMQRIGRTTIDKYPSLYKIISL